MEESVLCPICRSTCTLDTIECPSCSRASTAEERDTVRQCLRHAEPAESNLTAQLMMYEEKVQHSLARRRTSQRVDALRQRVAQAEAEYNAVRHRNQELSNSNSSRRQRRTSIRSRDTVLDRAQRNLDDATGRVDELTDNCRRYQARWVDRLFSLFRIKRKAEHSVSIAGIEIEEVFDGTKTARPAQEVSTALSHLVLVLNLLSGYLSIEFPFTMKFVPTRAEITRYSKKLPLWYSHGPTADFTLAVRLLDKNIRHLCLRAHVPLKEIEAFHLVPNLFALFQHLSLPQSRGRGQQSNEAAIAELSLMNSVMLDPSSAAEPFHTTQLTHWDFIEAPEAEVPRPSNELELAQWERAMQIGAQSNRKNSLI